MVGTMVVEMTGATSLLSEAATIDMKFQRLLKAFGRCHTVYNCSKKLQNTVILQLGTEQHFLSCPHPLFPGQGIIFFMKLYFPCWYALNLIHDDGEGGRSCQRIYWEFVAVVAFLFCFLFCSTAKANQITQTQCESCVLNTCIHWDLNVFLPTDNKLIVPYTR